MAEEHLWRLRVLAADVLEGLHEDLSNDDIVGIGEESAEDDSDSVLEHVDVDGLFLAVVEDGLFADGFFLLERVKRCRQCGKTI